MIVDVHHHFVDPLHYPEYQDFPAQLVEAMDRYGWDWTCLNGVGSRFHGKGNLEVAKAVERFPHRLAGIGHLDMDGMKPDQVDELRRMGMRGLKVIATRRRYDDDGYLPFFERAAKARLPILFHTGFLGGAARADHPVDESSDYYRPIVLDRIARLFPDLVLIAAHMGTVIWMQEAIAMTSHPNVFGDSSGGVSGLDVEFFRLPMYRNMDWPMDWSKVLFGSDSLPNDAHIGFNALKRLLAELNVNDATQRGVFGETAARIFALEER